MIALLLLLLLASSPATPAEAQQHSSVSNPIAKLFGFKQKRPSKSRRGRRQVDPPPNCERIRDAVRTLEPDRLEKALRESNPKQRAIIEKCTKG